MQSINYLFWPDVCSNCAKSIGESDGPLCRDCWNELLAGSAGDYCSRCGKDVSKYALLPRGCADCQEKEIHFDAISRAGIYTALLRNLILKFKLSDRTELKPFLSFLAEAAFDASTFRHNANFFVPVPLHWTRRFIRGYNQSHLIAKGLIGNSATINRDLVRIRKTKRQAVLTDTARRANVKDAFAVRKGHRDGVVALCVRCLPVGAGCIR